MTTPTSSETRPDGDLLWFTVVDEMHPIPLDEDPRLRTTRAYEALLRRLPDHTPAQCWDIVCEQEKSLTALITEGAVYLATCVALSEAVPARQVVAQFCVTVKEVDLPADRPLAAVARTLSAANPRRPITFDALPAGEALMFDEEVVTTGPGIDSPRTTQCAQVVIAFPDRKRIAMLALSTEDGPDWPDYRNLLTVIARTVSFTDPAEVHSGQ